MSAPKKNVVYSPSKSDFKHMLHCTKLNLIVLSMSRTSNYKDEYNVIRLECNFTPPRVHYFLKDFNLPSTPNNRATYTELEAYVKIFQIYKEFYMRNTNVKEETIMENAKKEAEEKSENKIKNKPKNTNKTRKEAREEKMLNFPHKQIDLLDMIDECEKEA